MANLRDASIFALGALSFVACSDDPAKKTPDAAIVLIDAPADTAVPIDAPPDAPSYDFSCEGQALPTAATATITLSGTATTLTAAFPPQTVPADGVLVRSYRNVSPEPVQPEKTATTPTDGTFSLANHLNPTMTPYDVYIKATKTNNRTSYTYPPSPFVGDQAGIPVLSISDATFGQLVTLAFSDSQDPAKGAVGVAVVDCANTPIAAAVLKVTQGGVDVGRQHHVGDLIAQAQGVWVVLDVPVGDTVISATYLTHTWRLHTIKSFAGATSQTIATP